MELHFVENEMTLKKALKVLVVYCLGLLIGAILCLASGCGTIYGIASDVEEGSRAVRKLMEPSQVGLREVRIERAADLVLSERGYQRTETPEQED